MTHKLSLSGLWITVFVVSLVLNAFAFIGNLIVVLACFFQKKRPSLIVYIHALAISDFCYSIVAPLYTYRYVLQYWPKLTINFALAGRLSHHVMLVGNTFSSISCWLVVALTIDRLILIKFPFKACKWSTPKRSYFAILLIVICCLIINGICFYDFFEVPITVNECDGSWNIPKQVKGTDNSTYMPIRYRPAYRLYAIVTTTLTFYILPTLTMLISNITIMLAFRRKRISQSNDGNRGNCSGNGGGNDVSPREKMHISGKKAAEIQLTKMILVVSEIFLICNIPDIATRLMWKFMSPLIVANVQPIAHLFLMINVGANFVVYALFNKHLFVTIIMWRRKDCRLHPSHIISSSNKATSCSSSSA